MEVMDEAKIKVSLINSWRVYEDKALNSCVYSYQKCCNIQDLVSLDKCLLLTRKSQDNSPSKCRIDIKLQNSKNLGFTRFSILSEAKFIELHVNEYREYVNLIKCDLIESIDDMNMFQADYSFLICPQFFTLTLIPKDSNCDRIWIFALGVETRELVDPLASLKSLDISLPSFNELKKSLIQAAASIEPKLVNDKHTKELEENENVVSQEEDGKQIKVNTTNDHTDLKSYIDLKFAQMEQFIVNQIEEKISRLESNLIKLIKS